jgi:hypothetical protein
MLSRNASRVRFAWVLMLALRHEARAMRNSGPRWVIDEHNLASSITFTGDLRRPGGRSRRPYRWNLPAKGMKTVTHLLDEYRIHFVLHIAPACVTSYSHSDTASAAASERVFSMPAMMKDYRLVHRPMD